LTVVGALLDAGATHQCRSHTYDHLLYRSQTQGITRTRVER
jgi:hypothetical protein